MLVGILISSSKKEVLSVNTLNPLNFGPDSEQKGTENLTLFKGVSNRYGKILGYLYKRTVLTSIRKRPISISKWRKKTMGKIHTYSRSDQEYKRAGGHVGTTRMRSITGTRIFSAISLMPK